MQPNTDRIRTTHVGSLPRRPDLLGLLLARERGDTVDSAAYGACLADAVKEVVARQVATGIDLVSDGESGKIAYSLYVKDRLTGFGGQAGPRPHLDLKEFPEFAARAKKFPILSPNCIGPIAWKNREPLDADLRNFRSAVSAAKPVGTFMTAASPGLVAYFMPNRYFPTHEAYLEALGAVLREEYDAIIAAGFDLQLDCPDLAMSRHIGYSMDADDVFRRKCEAAVDVLNAVTSHIPAERMRMHLCWGNYSGPHHFDLPLERVLPLALKARPSAISFEGANPRHEHEWEVFSTIRLPEDRLIIPGVIDSTTNFIEHPRLVAQRIERYAGVVGRERVIAGVDCGFATIATYEGVDPEIAWAKLGALSEGARLASQRLWKH